LGGGLGGFVGCEVEGVDVLEGAEPGALGFGKAAGVDFDLFDGVGEGGAAFEVVDDFGVANGLCGLGADGGVFGEEGTDLVEQTCVDHAFDAEVDAVVVVFAGAS